MPSEIRTALFRRDHIPIFFKLSQPLSLKLFLCVVVLLQQEEREEVDDALEGKEEGDIG